MKMTKFWLFCFTSLLPFAVSATLVHGKDSSNGDQVLRVNSSGQITTTLISGEDTTNNVLKVEGQFGYTTCNNVTADAVCKGSAGFLHTLTCGSDAAATAGTLVVRDSTSATSGTILFTWTFSATEIQPRTLVFDTVMGTGIALDFTTTADVTCQVSYR